jgi:hypothetical protein
VRTYGQLLHSELTNYPDTRPWPEPVEMDDAAHLLLREPVYVCPRGEMWIRRPDADPLQTVLARATEENIHIATEAVEYVIWSLNQKGDLHASAICREADADVLVSATNRQPLPSPRDYRWQSAMNWDDNGQNRLIVTTSRGISIITLGEKLTDDYCDLLDSPATTRVNNPPPQVLFDTRGILAWIPADGDFRGPSHVARFVEGKWQTLNPATWPADMIHLVPMFDGHVLQIRRGDSAGTVQMNIVALDSSSLDEKEVAKLAQQLGDDDPAKRDDAFKRLTQFGPEVYPILLKLEPDASLEAAGRIRELLEGRLAPTLGGMLVNENKLSVVSRLDDGGVIFFAPQGVSIPQDQQEARVVSPDYLAVRPGRPVEEVPEAIVHQLTDSGGKVFWKKDEWVLENEKKGPMRYLPPDQLVPLLRPSEREFGKLVAIDGRGRWIFRPEKTPAGKGGTLIIDPTVPDPTPRLAIWSIGTATAVGWNKNDWPVMKTKESKWIIGRQDLQLLDQKTDQMVTEIAAIPSSRQATTASTEELQDGPLLMTDAEGNRYYDGQTDLIVLAANGKRTAWTLPVQCAGLQSEQPHLVADGSGHLLLFNSIGRIARLRPTPAGKEPFLLEAEFAKNVPVFDDTRRIWLDPAGRIVVAYGSNRLAIIFPTGQISPDLADQILPDDLKRCEP